LKIANVTPKGMTVISNDEFNHYSNLIILSHQ
jgi:hypothetical protein